MCNSLGHRSPTAVARLQSPVLAQPPERRDDEVLIGRRAARQHAQLRPQRKESILIQTPARQRHCLTKCPAFQHR